MVETAAVEIRAGPILIDGDLALPHGAVGLVIFAHGSGSSRFSRRNRYVAEVLHRGRYATLMLDLLTREEEAIDERTREYRFDVDRLGHRVVAAIEIVPGATHLFEEPGALERVAQLALGWCQRHLEGGTT